MTDTDGYNGWKNRETWAFNLHWQNDQGLYNMVLDAAREGFGLSIARGDLEVSEISNNALGERCVEYIVEELPEISPELWENMRSDVGSFWRVDRAEVGACVRESLDNEGMNPEAANQ